MLGAQRQMVIYLRADRVVQDMVLFLLNLQDQKLGMYMLAAKYQLTRCSWAGWTQTDTVQSFLKYRSRKLRLATLPHHLSKQSNLLTRSANSSMKLTTLRW